MSEKQSAKRVGRARPPADPESIPALLFLAELVDRPRKDGQPQVSASERAWLLAFREAEAELKRRRRRSAP